MLRPENVLDRFVRELKSYERFKDVRFIHAKKALEPEKPVESFFVACGVGAVHKEKDILGNRKYKAQLEFNIYAPYNVGARELSSLAVSLMESLDRSDTQGEISDIKVSDPVYDMNLCTLNQKVCAEITWEIAATENEDTPAPLPQSSTVAISVNGVKVQVLSATAQVQEELYVLRELLFGDTDRYISKGAVYTVSVTVESVKDPFEEMDKIDISLNFAGRVRTFRDCKVAKFTEKKNAQNVPVREYSFTTIKSDVREESGKLYE